MTIATQTSEARFTAIVDGTPLSCNFPCNATTDVVVRYGADLVATLGVHYSVALAGDFQSFTVTPIAGFAALSGGIVSVAREVPLTQAFDLETRGEIGSSALVQALDYLTMITQQLKTKFDRGLFFPFTDAAAARGELPASADRASKYLAFDSNGVPVATSVVTAGALVTSAFGVAWVALASTASALVSLGFTTVGAFGKTLVATADQAAARTALGTIGAGDNIAFTGNNTFASTSDFAGVVTVLAPAANTQPATKKYVDDAVAAVAPSGAPVNQSTQGLTCQVLTAGVLYTKPAGCVSLFVEIQGPGGSGGINVAGNAGASGTTFNGVTAASGAGGGALTPVNGGRGGVPGSGGAGTATVRRSIGRGEAGTPIVTGADALGGAGGGSQFGPGGAAGNAAAANTGAGGGGAGGSDGVQGAAGGGGAGEYVQLVINGPLNATYAYAIGPGGTSAGAGSGAGGSGKIVVWESYNY